MGEFTDAIKGRGLPLVDLIESGSGFRIGSPDLPFVLQEHAANRWTHVNQEHSLQVESELRWMGSCALISRRLVNIGQEVSSTIDVIEPLHLVFDQPPEKWRHVYANGGTTENHYPPMAYRTQECTRLMPRKWLMTWLTIESHPWGRSSNLHLPFLISLASTDQDSDGLFCSLEWSATWYMRCGMADENKSCLEVGVKVKGLRLEPGESLELPTVHLGFYTGGPSAGTNALRRYLYESVCAKYQGKLMIPRVSYDHWFGIENRLNYELMCKEAERAAELGVETFVVDASWFPGDFPYGVGNWDKVDAAKFPEGLEPLAEYIRELGMDFGLWFEVERAVEGTSIVRDHPEWVVPVADPRPRRHPKQLYHLNLANREAQDWVVETVGGWIERLDIRWSRWDYNIEPQPFWEALDPTRKIQFEYIKGLYRVLDTLMREHPDWMVEGCSSGGRRIDMGTMRRAHTYWFSDQTVDPFLCRYMQARANRFLPGHLCNSSVAVEFGAGDDGFDDTAALSRMLGKLAFDGDIASWSPELTERMVSWVSEFKAVRHLMVQDFYQLLPIPTTAEDWDALQFVSYVGDEAALFVYAGVSGGRRTIRLQGLNRDRTYAVGRRPDGESVSISGSQLMDSGLEIELGPNKAGMWRVVSAG